MNSPSPSLRLSLLGDKDTARRLFQESLGLKRALFDRRGIAIVLGHLGLLEMQENALEQARADLEQAIQVATQDGAPVIAMENTVYLAQVVARQGDTAHAQKLALQAQQHPAAWHSTKQDAQKFLDTLSSSTL